MSQITTDDDVSIHYRLEGPEDAPVLVMSNSLGTDHTMWDPQMPALLQRFRVLRYDTRGHGKSSVPKAPYLVDRLGKDVIALMDDLDIPKAMFCGLSMGGMTGMWLGVHAPDRFSKLVLCNTAAKIGTSQIWNDRIATVRKSGMAAITPGGIQRWLTGSSSRPIRPWWKRFQPCCCPPTPKAIAWPAARCATWTSAKASPASVPPPW